VEVSQETFGLAQILMVWWSDITLQCVWIDLDCCAH